MPRITSCVSDLMYMQMKERQIAVVASNPFLVDFQKHTMRQAQQGTVWLKWSYNIYT